MRENTDQNNFEYEHFLRSGNRHLIHPFAGAFLILLICLGQKVFMCYILSVYEKGILIFFISLYFAFYFRQFCTGNCRPVFNFLTVLDCPFYYFSKKNLLICPQNLDLLMISNLKFPQPLKFKPNSFRYTLDYPNNLLFETQEDFSSRILKYFCCRSNLNVFSRLIYPYLL